MRRRLGIDDVRPRTAVIIGILWAVVFVLTVVPDPFLVLQVVSALAAIGSFIIAVLNWRENDDESRTQRVSAAGGGPQTIIQIGDDMQGRLTYIETNSEETDEESETDNEST